MHHSWWKFTYMLWWTSYDTPCNKKLFQMVNKKGVEIVHFVCLSCHFDMGLFHILGQEVPQLTLLMILLCLQWYLIELALFPKLSNKWCKYLYSRGMRHSTHSLSSTLLIFAFTLALIIQDAMIGAMRAWHQWIPYCNH